MFSPVCNASYWNPKASLVFPEKVTTSALATRPKKRPAASSRGARLAMVMGRRKPAPAPPLKATLL